MRRETRFVVTFAVLLIGVFTVIALEPVDRHVIVPFTTAVAHVSGALLRLLGEQATVDGVIVASPRFRVAIFNGCNGVVTSLIFAAGVLSFPARWKAKLIGLVAGLAVIHVVNLIRILALFYTGVFWPGFFGAAHIWVWQTIVIAVGVALWVVWAERATRRPAAA